MTLRPDNLITPDEARKLGLVPGSVHVQSDPRRKSRGMKPPAPSRDTRRPWLDTVLKRTAWKGDLAPEESISAELAARLVAAEIEGRCHSLFQHVANEGKRSPAAGALLKHIGMFPGAPDWWFLWSGGCGTIELKAPDGDKDPVTMLRPAQKDFRAWCAHHGVRHAVCTSVEDAWATLVEWGAVVG